LSLRKHGANIAVQKQKRNLSDGVHRTEGRKNSHVHKTNANLGKRGSTLGWEKKKRVWGRVQCNRKQQKKWGRRRGTTVRGEIKKTVQGGIVRVQRRKTCHRKKGEKKSTHDSIAKHPFLLSQWTRSRSGTGEVTSRGRVPRFEKKIGGGILERSKQGSINWGRKE